MMRGFIISKFEIVSAASCRNNFVNALILRSRASKLEIVLCGFLKERISLTHIFRFIGAGIPAACLAVALAGCSRSPRVSFYTLITGCWWTSSASNRHRERASPSRRPGPCDGPRGGLPRPAVYWCTSLWMRSATSPWWQLTAGHSSQSVAIWPQQFVQNLSRDIDTGVTCSAIHVNNRVGTIWKPVRDNVARR